MKPFTKQFDQLVTEIVTGVFVFPNFHEGELPEMKYFTHNAVWDTGSDQTIIAPYVAEGLGLKPIGKENLRGIGGITQGDVFLVTIGLPNGELKHDFKVYAMDVEDYDVLLGMDLINQCDFAITNQNQKTTFSFQTPSSTTIDFQKI